MFQLDKSNIRILIVDDTLRNIQMLGTILKQEGYQINVAQNGTQAINLAQKILPDLILLDIMMPEMDGFEACRYLKNNPLTQAIPIIFLTARSETENVVEGFQLGAVDYIIKPFNATELLVRVHTHLNLKKSIDMLAKIGSERKELLHILCHDLANPMHSIISILDVLESAEEFINMRGILLDAANQGLEIINLVRQMRALEEHRLTLKEIPLLKVVNTSVNILQRQFEQKSIHLEIDVGEDLIVCVEEVSMSNSVLNNLLTNALKFSYPNSVIYLRGRKQSSESVELSIEDHGIGIPEMILKNLFDVSKTTSREGTCGELGTGFGMPLVQKFMHAYGGKISVSSKSEREFPDQHGTLVTLTLPYFTTPS